MRPFLLAILVTASFALLPTPASADSIAGSCRTYYPPNSPGIDVYNDGTLDFQTAPLYRRVDGGAWVDANDLPGTTMFSDGFFDTNINYPSNTLYEYRAGSSNILQVRPTAAHCGPPTSPVTLTATCYLDPTDSPKRVVLNWTQPGNQKANSLIKNINGANGFWIPDCCGFGPMLPSQFSQFSYTDYAVSPGNTYSYRHKSDAGSPSWSATVNCPPPTPPPPADDAQYVSQTVSDGMTVTAGQPFMVSLTMRNTGTTTWTPGAVYQLGNQLNPAIWGLTRADMSMGASITTGQTVTFTWAATAPATPGTYPFQWRMIRGAGWFGQPSQSVNIIVAEPNLPPSGTLSSASCTSANGTASDSNAPGGVTVRVRTSVGGPLVGEGPAAPSFAIPVTLPAITDGLPKMYDLYVYAVDVPSGTEWALSGSPQTVTCNPPPPTVTSATATTPDYCTSGPGATVTWTSDANPQSTYEVIVTDSASPGAGTRYYQSGPLAGTATSRAVTLGAAYNLTLWGHVRVWNPYNAQPSQWGVTASFTTPSGPYPSAAFTYAPSQVFAAQPVQFTDASSNATGWLWDFGDGQGDTLPSPSHTYATEGTYSVTLKATNAAGNCTSAPQILGVGQALPSYREVRPGSGQ